jgi:heptosyltransferase-2
MRIGLFLPNWIGDVVMATPALRTLRQHFREQAELVGIMRPYVQQVLAGSTWLDDSLVYDRGSVNGLRDLIRRMREQRFDIVLLLTNSFSTAAFAWLAGVPRRVGFALHGRRMLLTDPLMPLRKDGKRVPHSAVDHYLEVAGVLGCQAALRVPELAVTDQEEQAAESVWRQFGWSSREPVAVLSTGGAYGAAKSWPAEHFLELSRRLVSAHDLRVLFLCGPSERETVADICRQADHPRIQCLAEQKPSVGLSKACVHRARLMITTDSGPRHFAAAFGVPVVTLFGPTDPRWSYNYAAAAIDLHLDVDCGPCARRVCPLAHHRCMRDLSVEHVEHAAATLLVTTARQNVA